MNNIVALATQGYDVVIVGGGAAGFFCAAELADRAKGCRILILEKTPRLLSKVRISGGGRCNVANGEQNPFRLATHYPRGEKKLKDLFRLFSTADTIEWFRRRGVELKCEPDGRMFPATNSSATIVDCFLNEAKDHSIEIVTNEEVCDIKQTGTQLNVTTRSGSSLNSHAVVITSGGHAKASAYDFISKLGITIRSPQPSLFTFNVPDSPLRNLMGVSVSDAEVRVVGTRFVQKGALLITHWGVSGPAVIKLSAWAAEHLASSNYDFTVSINWIGSSEAEVRNTLETQRKQSPKGRVAATPVFSIPSRLWASLVTLADAGENLVWGEMPNRVLNKLVENMVNFHLPIQGKTTFKEEFVTCGGVDLAELDLQRMESKRCPHLHFAGEVLDIDGETGGFNFQAAWTTAYIAAKAVADSLKEKTR